MAVWSAGAAVPGAAGTGFPAAVLSNGRTFSRAATTSVIDAYRSAGCFAIIF